MATIEQGDGHWTLPKVYRPSSGWLATLVLCGALLFAGGAVGSWSLLIWTNSHAVSQYCIMGICLAFAILGVYCVLATFRSRVVLFTDRVEIHDLIKTRIVHREAIRAWRMRPSLPPVLVFEPQKHAMRRIKTAILFPLDDQFLTWLSTLPNLDREERKQARAQARNDVRLGRTPGERFRRIAAGKRFALIVNAIALLLSAWGFFYPRPYDLVMTLLIFLPWVALFIVRRSKGLIELDDKPHSVHPNIAISILGPPLVLLLRSTDYNLIEFSSLIWITVVFTAVFMAFVLIAGSRLSAKTVQLWPFLFFALMQGWGTAVQANALLDRSTEANCQATVISKKIVRGKHTEYRLELTPWGPKPEINSIRVNHLTYKYIQNGDTVNLGLHRGAFGARWYFMVSWQGK